ncbi:MPN domain-containing protein-like isoform X2 [Neocloeon triangulifer]|uniref:MPN domain-containing protein-like isoform X2 n=1 Tax=Neocloeon triangulifer TaxID=2078957 RepID=UPI00286ECA19|nr:MPN domain-containing protein-like isoform X2 [Neocloeon triangulifer]
MRMSLTSVSYFGQELEDSLGSPLGCTSGEESEGGTHISSPSKSCVTLFTLLRERLLTPGEGAMSIHYLGQTFVGDLLPNGKIRSQETDLVFSSPSAWAIHCKKIINPDKKSGCGWASVKYKGRKLDAYKNAYFKKKRLDMSKENAQSEEEEVEKQPVTISTCSRGPKTVVKHSVLGCRTANQDTRVLVESVPFPSLGKIQPFLVQMSTNACMVMDFHCHLTNSEVVGYLAGHWDVNSHTLSITNAFPCRCRLGDRELAAHVEVDIYKALEQRRLTLVGWYHSHPRSPAAPSIKDIDAQLEYEIKMKGPSDATYTPCVGVICSPYYQPEIESTSKLNLESSIMCYWVMPPPDNRPLEYARPMLMSYSVAQEQFLSQDALNEMKKCAEFYKGEPDAIKFADKVFDESVTYLDKLKASLSPKFPRDQNEELIWSFVLELVSLGEKESPAVAENEPTASTSKVENGHASEMEKIENQEPENLKKEATALPSEDVAMRDASPQPSTSKNNHEMSMEIDTRPEVNQPEEKKNLVEENQSREVDTIEKVQNLN